MAALVLRPIVVGEFPPFGDEFRSDETHLVNNGNALRFDLPARLALSASEPRLATDRVEAKQLAITVADLEYHPKSSQAIVPITTLRFLVVVAADAADGSSDARQRRVFIGQRCQSVNYRPGVSRVDRRADEDCDFRMLIWEQDAPANCQTPPLPSDSDYFLFHLNPRSAHGAGYRLRAKAISRAR